MITNYFYLVNRHKQRVQGQFKAVGNGTADSRTPGAEADRGPTGEGQGPSPLLQSLHEGV